MKMTREDLSQLLNEAFCKGVEEGRQEAHTEYNMRRLEEQLRVLKMEDDIMRVKSMGNKIFPDPT